MADKKIKQVKTISKSQIAISIDNLKRFFINFMSTYVVSDSDKPDEVKNAITKQLLYILKGITFMLMTFFFAKAPMAMETYPLGLAFMCSSSKFVPFSYVGAIAAALTNKTMAFPLFVTYSIAFILRFVVSRWLFTPSKAKISKSNPKNVTTSYIFTENLPVRMVIGGCTAFLISLYKVISGGFLYYDLFGALFLIVAVPVMIFVYSGFFDKNKKYTSHYEAGIAGIIFSVVFSLKGLTVFGFSLSIIVAFIVTLYISKVGGVMRGGVIGLLCGVACDPMYAPIFGISGFAAGLFWNFSAIVSVIIACILGISYGIYLEGFNALRTLAPDLLGASILFTPFVQWGILPKLMIFRDGVTIQDKSSNLAIIAEKQQESTMLKLEALSTTLCSLSEVFYNLSDRLRRPGIYDIKQMCDSTCDKYCHRCSLNVICWEREYSSTVDVINKITKQLYQKGRVENSAIPEFMVKRCLNLDKIVAELNFTCAGLLEDTIKRDKTEIFAMDYEAMSKILEHAIEENSLEFNVDEQLCKKLKRSMHYMDFVSQNITVYGSRRKNIIAGGVDLSKVRLGADEIRRAFENTCSTKFCTPQFNIDNEYITMTMSTAKKFSVEYAKASNVKKEEEINGDVISMFDNKDDYFYTLISDGMGSGRDAALTSQICSVFLEKMLECGNKKSVTLEMLNNFIRNKNMECFATVDLIEIDMLDGEASFIKSGAAPSFILRNGNLFKITSNTMPIGIMRGINAEQIKFDLDVNDVIVMMSDGIAQGLEESIWLANLLTYEWNDDLDLMAEKIISKAIDNNERSDDMTVGLIRVNAA